MFGMFAWLRYRVFDEDIDVPKGQMVDWTKVVKEDIKPISAKNETKVWLKL